MNSLKIRRSIQLEGQNACRAKKSETCKKYDEIYLSGGQEKHLDMYMACFQYYYIKPK